MATASSAERQAVRPGPAEGSAGGRRLATVAILLGLFAICWGINRIPLIDPDEGRNAEVAREMLAARDLGVPHFQGLPYLDKPALYFDAVALSQAVFGRSEASSRLPSVLFAAATAIATFLLGALLLGRRKALFGAAVLMTAPLFVGFARIVIFDMPLTCFVTLALLFAEEGRRGRRWGFPLSWAATALAVLTKGPVGLLLPILGTVTLSLGQARPLRLKRYFHPLNIVLFFAIALPWVIAMEIRNPGFLRYVFVIETFERLTQPTFHRTGSAFYYVPVLLLGLFPWSLAALGRVPAWIKAARGLARPSPERGLVLASLAIVLFFSFSTSKLGGYVLPAFPLLAILVGGEAARQGERPGGFAVVPGIVLLVLGAVLSLGLTRGMIAHSLRQPEALSGATAALLLRVGVLSIAAGAALIALAAARRAAPTFLVLGLWLPCVVVLGCGPMLLYAEENSSRRLATELRRLGGDDVRAVSLKCFPIGLDYYMGRVVPVATSTGEEITSTYVARCFDKLRQGEMPGIWSPEELAARVSRKEVDIIITRGHIDLVGDCSLAGRVGRFDLWRPAPAPTADAGN
jgi:4-amino-4-deoxy-L-arabinose transferase-like glycosyltransferase